jgi:uncharacterized membrane protein YtjA (UPF0391 family)
MVRLVCELFHADGNAICGAALSRRINWIGKDRNMLRLALAFFIVAIIAALFGFGGIAAGAASIAQILFFLFVVLFLIALVVGLVRGRSPRI